VRIWDPARGGRTDLPGHQAPSEAVYSGDGAHIVSASQDGVVRLWNVKRGTSRLVPSFSGDQYGLAINRDGSRVAISTFGHPTVVQRTDGRARAKLRGHGDLVFALAFSPDGKHVVSASADTTARIWNATTGRRERTLPHNEAVIDARYSGDGRYVATGSSDGTVRVWPTAGGPPVLHYGHVGEVNTVAFDTSGKRVVSAGTDGTVRIWNAARGETLATLHVHGENALGASFSPDGKSVASTGEDSVIRVTPCEVCGSLADVLKVARSRPVRALSPAERRRLLSDDG